MKLAQYSAWGRRLMTLGALVVVGTASGAGAEGAPGLGAPAQPAGESAAGTCQAVSGPAAPAAAAGMTIYRDPVTGQLGVAPPGVIAIPPGAPPRKLVERPGPTPGGGVLLEGVPPQIMKVTRDAAGATSTRCETGGPSQVK